MTESTFIAVSNGTLEMEQDPMLHPQRRKSSYQPHRDNSTQRRIFIILICVMVMMVGLSSIRSFMFSEENNTHMIMSLDSVAKQDHYDTVTNGNDSNNKHDVAKDDAETPNKSDNDEAATTDKNVDIINKPTQEEDGRATGKKGEKDKTTAAKNEDKTPDDQVVTRKKEEIDEKSFADKNEKNPSTRKGNQGNKKVSSPNKDSSPEKTSQSKASGLQFAWLMSFPNSGTSYTMKSTLLISKRTTATNYGYINPGDDGLSIVFEERVNSTKVRYSQGPFRKTMADDLPPAHSYILTKTHCGGRCTECSPENYVETLENFKRTCVQGRRKVRNDDPSSSSNTKEVNVEYDPDIIQRAIHLIRDPFDNVISRFHLHYKHKVIEENEDWLSSHPKNVTGFQAWCQDNDAMFSKEEAPHYKQVRDIKTIPCHAEFFRYTQWHNLAFEVVEDMEIPVHMLHYEDYQDDFNNTLSGIFEFLNLDMLGQPSPFYTSDYSDYYSEKQRKATINMIKALASERTWSQLASRYEFR